MATTQTKHTSPSIEPRFERATEAGEQFVAASRKAGNLYLDSYEKAVDRAIELELKVAGATPAGVAQEPDRGPGRLRPRAHELLHERPLARCSSKG